MRVRQYLALAVLVLIGSVCDSSSAWADFSPGNGCSLCPTTTEYNWSYSVSSTKWELPPDPTSGDSKYINYLNNTRYVISNRHAKQIGIRRDSFNSETNYDYLDRGRVGAAQSRWTGDYGGPSWFDSEYPDGDHMQKTPYQLMFFTDGSITDFGFSLGKARVCCRQFAASGNETNVTKYARYSGILTGTHDTIYMKAPTSPSGRGESIVIWPNSPGDNTDFDIYLRCNALPTVTTYDARSVATGSDEGIRVGSGVCAYPGTWYLAIYSYSGSGAFNLMWSSYYTSQSRVIKAGANWNASTDQMNQFHDTLWHAMRQFYGATEGTNLITRVDLYNNTGTNCTNCGGSVCDLCFENWDGNGKCGWCCDGNYNDHVEIYQCGFGDGETVAHEWGHKYLDLDPDEYHLDRCCDAVSYSCNDLLCLRTCPQCSASCNGCGHSIMSDQGGFQNNLCRNVDHRKDKTPGDCPDATSDYSSWTVMYFAGKTPWTPSQTPDNYDFWDHDFYVGDFEVIDH